MSGTGFSPGLTRLRGISALLIGVLAAFSILAFAATERWALSVFQIAAFGLGILWLARVAAGPVRIHIGPVPLLVAAAAAWGGVQLAAGITIYRFATTSAVLEWGAYLVLLMVSIQTFLEREVRARFLIGFLYFGFALAILSVTQFFTSGGLIYWTVPTSAGVSFGPFVNRDHYAALIELLLPLAIFAGIEDRRRAWFHAAIAATLFASVIAGASRAGAILVTAEAALLFIIAMVGEFRNEVSWRSAGGKILLLGALYSGVVGWGVLLNRFQDPDPFKFRREMTLSALEMVRERPWTGFGMGAFENGYLAHAQFDIGARVDHAHNDWAEWGAEGGAPLFLAVLASGMWLLRAALRHPWGLGVPFVLLHCLVDFPMRIPGVAVFFFVLAGALVAAEASIERQAEPKPAPGVAIVRPAL